MSRRHAAGDLRAMNDHEFQITARPRRQFIGAVMILDHVRLVRLVFQVVSDGNGIQPFAPGLFRADGGPHQAVGENGMNVEVALECHIAGNIRHVDRRAKPGDDVVGQDVGESISHYQCDKNGFLRVCRIKTGWHF